MKIKRRPLEPGVPSVAMADIAFNLVLFFIIMARAQDDSHLQWEPAKASQTKRFGNAAVSVTFDKENKVYLTGSQVGIAQLSAAVASQLGSAPAGERNVLLK